MPATKTERRARAERMDRDRATLERVAIRQIRVIVRRTRTAVIQSFIGGADVGESIVRAFAPLGDLLAEAALAAHLAGRWRSFTVAAEHVQRAPVFAAGPYEQATQAVQSRLQIPSEQLDALAAKYGNEAARVTRRASLAVELSAQRAVRDIVQEGMHVREGVARMRESLDAAGITAGKPWIAETLVRTQIQIAYSAGQFNANQDPAIDEIIWGYEYSTVGDDRVRDEHAALEGARWPKDDPILESVWPPNGFNCRCVLLEIFKDDPPELRSRNDPEPITTPDGEIVRGGPDPGFAFNPGTVYRDSARVPTLPGTGKRAGR